MMDAKTQKAIDKVQNAVIMLVRGPATDAKWDRFDKAILDLVATTRTAALTGGRDAE